jgi:hypothetical protein
MSHSSENALPWTEILAEIKHHLTQIQYGSLEIQVHNGQVVQLERREKKRWDKAAQAKQIAS